LGVVKLRGYPWGNYTNRHLGYIIQTLNARPSGGSCHEVYNDASQMVYLKNVYTWGDHGGELLIEGRMDKYHNVAREQAQDKKKKQSAELFEQGGGHIKDEAREKRRGTD